MIYLHKKLDSTVFSLSDLKQTDINQYQNFEELHTKYFIPDGYEDEHLSNLHINIALDFMLISFIFIIIYHFLFGCQAG